VTAKDRFVSPDFPFDRGSGKWDVLIGGVFCIKLVG
jgi:hypothetical protein